MSNASLDLTARDNQDWQIRGFIFRHMLDRERPPEVAETAREFSITPEEAAAAYDRLHQRHAIYMDPGTYAVRIANPLSGIPTPFRVYANGHAYYANCAWDSIGISALLHTEARIEAQCAQSKEPITLIAGRNGIQSSENLLIHFPLPFSRWYEDMVFT